MTLCAGARKSRWLPQAIIRAIPKFTPMKAAALTPEIRMAIHVRAELLFDLITEAENSGASSELIDQLISEELKAMQAKLRAIHPPERVHASSMNYWSSTTHTGGGLLPNRDASIWSQPRARGLELDCALPSMVAECRRKLEPIQFNRSHIRRR